MASETSLTKDRFIVDYLDNERMWIVVDPIYDCILSYCESDLDANTICECLNTIEYRPEDMLNKDDYVFNHSSAKFADERVTNIPERIIT